MPPSERLPRVFHWIYFLGHFYSEKRYNLWVMFIHEIVLETIWKWCANVSFKGVFQLPRLACSPDISQIITGLPSTDQISRNNYVLRHGASVPNQIRRTSKHITHTSLYQLVQSDIQQDELPSPQVTFWHFICWPCWLAFRELTLYSSTSGALTLEKACLASSHWLEREVGVFLNSSPLHLG